MADVIRLLSFHSLPFHSSPSSASSSSSLVTSVPSNLNSSFQTSLAPNQTSTLPFYKRVYPVVYSSPVGGGSSGGGVSRLSLSPRKQSQALKVHATVAPTSEQPKWWEKNAGPNMIDIHSTQEFLSALSDAGDRLVIVEFYGTWCASCRALFPKLCRTAEEHPEILFLKVNFDENKPMCKSLNVKVLPYFHFYRGAHGQLESFSCSLAKFQKIKDAIALHNTASCSGGAAKVVGELTLESISAPQDKPAESTQP